jgi:hypothetical protein
VSAAVGGVVLALAAAGCFALANTLQHHGVNQAADERTSGPWWLRPLLTRPAWLAGIGADLVGMGLHGLALSFSALAVVQPVLVCALLFALPVSRLVSGRRIRAADYGWATVVVTGLSVFLVAAQPAAGHATAGRPLVTGIIAAAALSTAAVAMARRRGARHRAALLGLATGTVFGVVGAFTKEVAAAAQLGLPALLTSWPLYALTAAGVAGMLLSQAAYRAGPLTGSLPAITIADPVVAVALGVIGFGETLVTSPPVLAAAAAGFVAMTAGVVALARGSVAAQPIRVTGPGPGCEPRPTSPELVACNRHPGRSPLLRPGQAPAGTPPKVPVCQERSRRPTSSGLRSAERRTTPRSVLLPAEERSSRAR